MIAKKVFNADGSNKRFLSDFIIQSEQFTRVYVYIFDETLNSNGSEDQLQNGSTNQADFSFPDNIWRRGADAPDSGDDLITIDKWDLVTNSILMYEAPIAPAKIWIEVATTPEEFGSTLTQPSVGRAEVAAAAAVAAAGEAAADVVLTNADVVTTTQNVATTNSDVTQTNADVVTTNQNLAATAVDVTETNADVVTTNQNVVITNADALQTAADVALTAADVVSTDASSTSSQLRAWEAEAARMTSESYAVQPVDSFVRIYTSVGDGTFTFVAANVFSALHHQVKGLAQDASTKLPKDGSEPMTGNLEAPSVSIAGVDIFDKLGIAYGANANGNWVKYPDGTLLQYGEKTVLAVPVTVANGALFRSTSASIQITYPLVFLGTNIVQINLKQEISVIASTPYNGSTSGTQVIITAVSSLASVDVTLTYMVIGRWK